MASYHITLLGNSNKILLMMNINIVDRRSFGSVLDIIRLANFVTKLTVRYEPCSKRACSLHLKENRGDTDWTDWWGWCLHACVSVALCQQTSSQGSCKDCPGISRRLVCLLCIVQLRKIVETQIELIGLSTCLCVGSTMSADN